MVVNFVDIGGIVDHHCLKPSFLSRDSTLKIGQPPIKAILPFVLHFHDKRLIHSLYVGSDLKVPPLGAI